MKKELTIIILAIASSIIIGCVAEIDSNHIPGSVNESSFVDKSDSLIPREAPKEIETNIEIQPQKQSIPSIQETPILAPKINTNCHPSYSGCLKPYASDYDCEGGSGDGPYYTGEVKVLKKDVFKLDHDGDGWGCDED